MAAQAHRDQPRAALTRVAFTVRTCQIGRQDEHIIDTLRKHSPHLPFADIYQCCLLVFGKVNPHTEFALDCKAIFHYDYARTLLLDMKLTAENVHAAVYHLTQAGEEDLPTGFLALAELYEHGLGSIIAIDPVEELKWRKRFAKLEAEEGPALRAEASDKMAKGLMRQARKRAFSLQLALD